MVTEPGWYEAEGDPPGSQRYWDGQVWVGHPVYEPTAVPSVPAPVPPLPGYVVAPPPNASVLSEGAKVTAIILAVLKALPLAPLALLFLFVLAWSGGGGDRDFEEFEDYGAGNLVNAATVVLGTILVVGILLLLFQFIGAITDRRMMVLIPAAIMALIDLGLAGLAWFAVIDEQASVLGGTGFLQNTLLLSTVAGAQIYVAVSVLRSKAN